MTSPDTFLCTFRHIVKDSYSPVGYNTYRFNVLSCSTMMSISLGILLLFHYSSNIYTIIVSPFHRDVIYKKHNRFLMSIQDCCTSVPIPVYQDCCTSVPIPTLPYTMQEMVLPLSSDTLRSLHQCTKISAAFGMSK